MYCRCDEHSLPGSTVMFVRSTSFMASSELDHLHSFYDLMYTVQRETWVVWQNCSGVYVNISDLIA